MSDIANRIAEKIAAHINRPHMAEDFTTIIDAELAATGTGLETAAAFEKWWAEREAEGYQYGREPLSTVRFGFEAGYTAARIGSPAQGGWRPIESAPTDDPVPTAFLVYCPDRKNIYEVFRRKGEERFTVFASGGRILTETPSGWQPLPPPPAQTEEK
jgi:hypothetical protein